MSESEPRYIGQRNKMPLTPAQKVAHYTSLIAEDRGLDRLTYEALSKYAIASLKIREIETDFRGTTEKGFAYAAYEDKTGKQCKMVLTRENYSDMINIISTISLKLYNKYLGTSEASRLAAKEVQVIINDVYPQSL